MSPTRPEKLMSHETQQRAEGRFEPPRKPYERPAIEQTSEFETLTLFCAFADASCAYGGGTENS